VCDNSDALFDDVVDGLDGDLRWRTRTFGGGVFAGAALWGGVLGVVAPLSARLPAPRVVLLLVVMTSPEESAHRMGLEATMEMRQIVE
jgi:hypothetical protein